MNSVMERIYAKARDAKLTICLPEAEDVRTVQAAEMVVKEGLANVVLIQKEELIEKAVKESGADISGCKIIDHTKSEYFDEFTEKFCKMREKKGMTMEKAKTFMEQPLYFGCMMVNEGMADGQVSGASHSTADTIRPALQILKAAPGCQCVSAFFLMIVPDCPYGANGVFIYADSGLVINPNPQELAEIAIQSSITMEKLCGIDPKVAMLSLSTKGSAHDPIIDKVIEATNIAKERCPDLCIDGELQADAALIEAIGASKTPGSSVAGKANVLIFPDLNCGNIAYKLTERLAKAEAYGPVLQGLKKPVNDLSRGCKASDIMNVVAITACQALY